ncbi:hypothetical protein R6Q57_005791 [Mikania cordata]
MQTNNKKKLIPTTTAVSVGCGSHCRKINLSTIFHPKPSKHKTNRNRNRNPDREYHNLHQHHESSFSEKTVVSSSRSEKGFGWLGGNSLAVEKDSSDPYVDFKESMLQMIMEEEIYEKDDLRELLNCFLQLNLPYYHPIILRAFTEIWNTLSAD